MQRKSWLHATQEKLILAAIFFTPIYSLAEILRLLNSANDALALPITALKALKDVLLLLTIVLGTLSAKRNRALSLSAKIIISFFLIISLAISISFVPGIALLAGMRWSLPIFFLFAFQEIDEAFIAKLALLMQRLLLLALLLQCVQLFYGSGLYGLVDGRFNLRNPGFYLIPSSMAGFTMATLFFTFISNASQSRKRFTFAASLISIILTASGTGIMSIALFSMALLTNRKNFLKVAFCTILLFIFILALLPLITGRENILTSLYGRFAIILRNVSFESLLFSSSFGLGTNTIINLDSQLVYTGTAIIADSMVSSSIINVGIPFLSTSILCFFLIPCLRQSKQVALYLSTFFPFYFTTVLFELFPVNVLMMIGLVYVSKKKPKREKRGDTADQRLPAPGAEFSGSIL